MSPPGTRQLSLLSCHHLALANCHSCHVTTWHSPTVTPVMSPPGTRQLSLLTCLPNTPVFLPAPSVYPLPKSLPIVLISASSSVLVCLYVRVCVRHTSQTVCIPLSLPSLLGPQRFVEIFGHNYGNGSERAADLDFVFVAFQEADSNSVRMHRVTQQMVL